MRIGELSARTGASVRMLRYYEEQGLLTPVRTGSGYRIYQESDVDRVARIRCMLSAALPSGVVGQALRFLLDGRAAIPAEPADRARLADTLQGELDQLTAKIESLESSRDLLATIVADVRGDVVGPGHPGDPGGAVARRSVRKAGPAVGLAR
ncbi:MerR family transcriptional regulator [Micromonospora palythoicola]|uniref:MerR family transcriptional regulator n=1 Tax=Micromonospora palythoicola TaxID=3120507 RepID=UPI002FCE00E4